MKFDPRNFDGQFLPSTHMFVELKFNSEEIEQFTIITYAIFNYTALNRFLISSKRLDFIKEQVMNMILRNRNKVIENNVPLHPKFQEMFDLFCTGSEESIEMKEASPILELAVKYFY